MPPSTQGGKRITIVCEGSRTEPQYFGQLKQLRRLRTVRVVSATPSDLTGVKRAVREAVILALGSDEVWCVVDDDERREDIASLREYLKRIQARKPSVRVCLALSMPCFEYWLLLHFEYTTRAFLGTPGRSACRRVISELKRHLPDYEKNDPRLFVHLQERLPAAVARAKRGRAEGSSFTDVGELVGRLLHLDDSGSS